MNTDMIQSRATDTQLAILIHVITQVALTMKLAKLKKQIEDSVDLDDDERNPYDPYQSQDMYDPITGRMLAKEQLAQVQSALYAVLSTRAHARTTAETRFQSPQAEK
jgi:hypothetical protein